MQNSILKHRRRPIDIFLIHMNINKHTNRTGVHLGGVCVEGSSRQRPLRGWFFFEIWFWFLTCCVCLFALLSVRNAVLIKGWVWIVWLKVGVRHLSLLLQTFFSPWISRLEMNAKQSKNALLIDQKVSQN